MNRPTKISKLLSTNDTGANGTHQAGILVPKDIEILSFFPYLDERVKNPRTRLAFTDESDQTWLFSFIYYNNKFFGGTRNEYRLTGMTKFMREIDAHAGDSLLFSRDEEERYSVALKRAVETPAVTINEDGRSHVKLTASSSWKVVAI